MSTATTHILATLSIFFLATIALCGCSNPQTLPTNSITVAGLERAYNLFVPENPPDGPMALVVAFHGGGGRGEMFPQQERFEALAESEGIVLAFPQGYAFPGNEGEWQLNTTDTSRHDIEFIAAMLDEIETQHTIDPARIYATGYSLGSMFTYEVACQMSDRFAAIASFAGTMPIEPSACEPQRFAPIMHLHGSDDTIISYDDTWDWKAWDEVGPMRDIPGLVNYWSTQYNCQTSDDTGTASSTHSVFGMCEQDARVELHRLNGLGHEWPDTINGVSTHQVIWSFVSEFTL